MKLVSSVREVISKTADDTKTSRNLVESVIKDFEKNIKWDIANPAYAKLNILTFGRFELSVFMCNKRYERNLIKPSVDDAEFVEFYRKFKEEHERQTEDADNHAGHSKKGV